MKKAAILYSTYTPTIDAIISRLEDVRFDCIQTGADLDGYDLVVGVGLEDVSGIERNIVNIHHSLLPAFSGEEPVKQAFLAGVKVTGLTIYYTNPEKIIAQYPVFISNDAHFDDVEHEIQYLEQTIYPIVLEKILNGGVFEIKDLLKSGGCASGCGGCGKCNH